MRGTDPDSLRWQKKNAVRNIQKASAFSDELRETRMTA
jgi:hypothetical protein